MTGPAPTHLHGPPPTTVVAGRYEILRELGRGGMATVHRARDLELDRDVALKLLHPHLSSDRRMVDRFRREAKAAASLEHPGVVTVHDWGIDDDMPYLVMQLVSGRSLRDVLDVRGRLTPGEALSLLAPAIAGLAAAHRSGIVHRDVTPGNILIGDDGASRIVDFGLARAVAATTSTFGDAVVGSPHYLSPEAARGEALDVRADVYSLGCVLYHCLTGRPPFDGDSPVVVAGRHLTDAVPYPSQLVPQGVPSEIDDLVEIATSSDPDDRYDDAAEFGRAFADAVEEGPVAVDLRQGSDLTVVLPEHATRVIGELPVDEDDEDRPRRRWFRRLLGWLLLVGIAIGTGYVVVDQVVAPITAVPIVTGMRATEARGVLEDAGFRVRIADERRFDRDVAAGSVVAQSTTEPTRQLSTIELVLSAGPRTGTLPPLAGRTVEDARAAIDELGLDLTVTEVVGYDDDLPAGTVLEAAPSSGSTVSEGTEVVLTVSDGPAPVELPDLVGEFEGAATAELVGRGLVARVAARRHDPAPAGTVIAMEPGPGATVRRGDEVALTVSDGPEPVEVPDVEGQREAEAIRILEAAGFTVDVRYVTTLLPLARGIVDEQDPDPGTTRPRGSVVRIFVWQ